eukprot:TRINITY_DN11106_c1_g1_i12.p1 TRINITY_DN11106_c1_g1~~TRINITY_DN11106_c1_g1_i12.p1  ORF type:complete len:217 (-),score=0.44 TRINITY_DN11106_c1_g1_i12:620-1270(-)
MQAAGDFSSFRQAAPLRSHGSCGSSDFSCWLIGIEDSWLIGRYAKRQHTHHSVISHLRRYMEMLRLVVVLASPGAKVIAVDVCNSLRLQLFSDQSAMVLPVQVHGRSCTHGRACSQWTALFRYTVVEGIHRYDDVFSDTTGILVVYAGLGARGFEAARRPGVSVPALVKTDFLLAMLLFIRNQIVGMVMALWWHYRRSEGRGLPSAACGQGRTASR